MPIPILYLITELSVGGAQTALLRLLTHLDRGRFSPAVACLYNGDALIAQSIRALDVEVVDMKMRHKSDLVGLWRLYRLLVDKQPTILHTHLFHANLSGRFLGRWAGVPIVINSEHTIAMEPEWRYRVNAWSSGLVDRVMTVSETMRQFCLAHIGLSPQKVVLIYNGVEFSETPFGTREHARLELGLPLEGVVIGAASRFDPVKGINYLIEAFAQIHCSPNTHLVLLGDGPQRPQLEALAQNLEVSDRIHWAGFRSDVPALLPALDIFVQPSVSEGLPMSVLEAMVAGLPVVATAVGGTPEIVTDGITGRLVSPRNPMALAQAMESLLTDSVLCRQMGQTALERVRHNFSAEQMTRRTEVLYDQLLADLKLL